MNKALEFAKEIKEKEEAVKKSNSDYFKRDYRKSIERDRKELKYYCKQKDIDFDKLMSF